MNKYTDTFTKMDDGKLIDAFNKEVVNTGWVSSRAEYLTALYQEFKNRNFDISEIETDRGFSLKEKIRLENSKVVIVGIPEGLVKCDVCGEYKGRVTEDENEGELLVQCICDGVECRNCGKKIHKPISNYFDETISSVIHVPHSKDLCSDCSRN